MTITTQSAPVLNWQTNRQLLQIIKNRKAYNRNGTLEVKRYADMKHVSGEQHEIWEISFFNPGAKHPFDRINFALNAITSEIIPIEARMNRVHHDTYMTMSDNTFLFIPEKVEMFNPVAEAWVNYRFGQFYQRKNLN
jgi:hypothetical protein